MFDFSFCFVWLFWFCFYVSAVGFCLVKVWQGLALAKEYISDIHHSVND